MLTVSSLSTEYVQVQVSATVNGVSGYNPTSDAVQFAFVATGTPTSGDWRNGSWQTITAVGETVYIAQCLIGPGGTALATGTYMIWWKVTDNPEIPVRQVGLLQIV